MILEKRRTEFRVWNGDDGVMVYGDSYEYPLGLDNEAGEVYIWGTKEEDRDGKEVTRMTVIKDQHWTEWTGLKVDEDKLWEGDIVEFQDYYTDDRRVGVVVFHEGAFAIKYENEHWDLYTMIADMKILGNVFENPEILEDVQD